MVEHTTYIATSFSYKSSAQVLVRPDSYVRAVRIAVSLHSAHSTVTKCSYYIVL
jgi:hypothetical protein